MFSFLGRCYSIVSAHIRHYYLFFGGLHWVFVAARALAGSGEWGLLCIAALGLLTVASLVADHGP